MIGINFTPILDVPVPFMLDANPADLGDKLDAVNAARLRWINFHTSMKTIFGQTRDRSSRRNAFLDKKSSTTRQCALTSTFRNLCLRLKEISLPLVYISTRVIKQDWELRANPSRDLGLK